MKLPKNLLNCEVQHRFGGNGYAVVCDVNDFYCRVVDLRPKSIGTLFLLAAKKLLKPWEAKVPNSNPPQFSPIPLNEDQAKALKAVQDKLASGKFEIRKRLLVDASTPEE